MGVGTSYNLSFLSHSDEKGLNWQCAALLVLGFFKIDYEE